MKENIKNTKSTSEIDTLSQRDNTLPQRDNTLFRENNKNTQTTKLSKEKYFFMCMCKMGVITVEKYENLGTDVIKLQNSDLFWINSGELRKKLYATNMSYLILHQMKGYFDNKSPTKKQIHQLYCSLKELLKDKKYSSKSI